MPTVPLRKRLAGADSYGHQWPEDGSVVDVDYDQAMDLLSIPDGGFTVADPPEDVSEPDPDACLSEVALQDDSATDVPAKKTMSRRTNKP